MGSLCCVAARPHGSNAASRDWSMDPHEPLWHTNTSFSPPPSLWDIRFQSEGLPHGWHDGVQLYGSSTSSNSKESRSWIRGNHLYTHNSGSDGAGLFFSSPSDISQGPQWTPPAIQEINVDGYETATKRDPSLGTFSFRPAAEGTSENPDSGSSTFSHSDSSETEPTVKLRSSSNWNFSSRRSFMSKPIYPLAIPMQTSPGEAFESSNVGFTEFDCATPQREDTQRWSSASSSIDFADVSEPLESDIYFTSSSRSDGFKCGICERFLSQRSPWSSRRIVRSTDMPVAGVLSCRHVFHAECLEQTTPKIRKSDPPCPLCLKHEDDHSPEQQANSRLKNANVLLRPKPSTSEDGLPRPWGCAQVGDCVEGALHAPPRNPMLLVNRNRVKNLSFKGNSSKEFSGKLRKAGSYSSRSVNARSFDHEFVGCSKTSAGPSLKR